MGVTLPLLPTGELGPSDPPAVTYMQPTVLVDNVPAEVKWSGYAPGMLGLYQINVLMPETAHSGVVDLSVVVNNIASKVSRCVIQ
jgi:uncharacterized protein (TIGR03437 family)